MRTTRPLIVPPPPAVQVTPRRRARRAATPSLLMLFGVAFIVMLADLALLWSQPGNRWGLLLVAYNALLVVLVIARFPRSPAAPTVIGVAVAGAAFGIGLFVRGTL